MTEASTPREIFRSANVRALYHGTNNRDRLLVFFLAFEPGSNESLVLSSLAFLDRLGADFVVVIPSSNAWYQYPEMPECLDAILGTAGAYRETVSYGTSMGGYEAIKSATHLKPDRVLAVTPQYSIDRSKADFETRWESEARATNFIDDEMNINAGTEYWLIYDPFELQDKLHVQLIASTVRNMRLIPIPFATHFCAHFLSETKLAPYCLDAILLGDFDHLEFRKLVRDRRQSSITYLSQVVQRLDRLQKCGQLRNSGLQRRLLEEIAQIPAINPRTWYQKSLGLWQLGRFTEAIEAARTAVAKKTDHPGFRKHLERLQAKVSEKE
jgi:hypothetical protein